VIWAENYLEVVPRAAKPAEPAVAAAAAPAASPDDANASAPSEAPAASEEKKETPFRVTGVTIPGIPGVILGPCSAHLHFFT